MENSGVSKLFRLLIGISLLVVLMSISFDGFSQNTSDENTDVVSQTVSDFQQLPDTAKATLSYVYRDIRAGLKDLGASLKVGADHVYKVLVVQQKIRAAINLSLFAISLIILSYCVYLLKLIDKLPGGSDDTPLRYVLPACISGIIGVGLFFILLFKIHTIFTGFMNPEYGAIREIMEFVSESR